VRLWRSASWLCIILLCLLMQAENPRTFTGTNVRAADVPIRLIGPQRQSIRICLGEQTCEVGDVNGDKYADLIAFGRETRRGAELGSVWVALGQATSFSPPERRTTGFCLGNEECFAGDINNDGRADLISFVKNTRGDNDLGRILVAMSTGKSFMAPQTVQYGKAGARRNLIFCIDNEICRIDDIDGDGSVDLVAFTRDSDPDRPGYVWVARSKTSKDLSQPVVFAKPELIKRNFCIHEEICATGEVAGQPGADLIAFARDTGSDTKKNDVWVYPTTPISYTDTYTVTLWHSSFCFGNEDCRIGNIDGSSQEDLIAFGSHERNENIVSYIKISLAEKDRFSSDVFIFDGDFCSLEDICKLADIDGNCVDDIVAFDRHMDKDPYIGNVRITLLYPIPSHDCGSCMHRVWLPLIMAPRPLGC
jgi:hypothetical protein